MRAGDRVLDLGCAPGSWAQYAAQRVGPKGVVIGYDLRPVEVPLPPNARCEILDVVGSDLPSSEPFDVVLSDMAPSTEGVRFADQYRSFELYCRALEMAIRSLRPGGSFVGKIFQGAELAVAKARTAAAFEEVRMIRPQGTRKESYELFLLGVRKRR